MHYNPFFRKIVGISTLHFQIDSKSFTNQVLMLAHFNRLNYTCILFDVVFFFKLGLNFNNHYPPTAACISKAQANAP